ncbi:unnamed protein product [Caenorhabditis bovis]|uniref:Uncharacterized protein n=1 Tax=Caenorhabditis bovis TaxID=2654633 RepID=A0A8S1E556_9PELO|nr:unnamed protein product [Caenorhabditis bovis]
MGRFNRPVNNGPREVPINHAHALGSGQPMNVNNQFGELAQQGANVLATGAHAFYRGAATVGQAFGIPQGSYEVPLLNQAASLFG